MRSCAVFVAEGNTTHHNKDLNPNFLTSPMPVLAGTILLKTRQCSQLHREHLATPVGISLQPGRGADGGVSQRAEALVVFAPAEHELVQDVGIEWRERCIISGA